ncbi:thiol-disulfide oxidoreductase DCC family protein [Allomuricauda sp. SCSIO 65647]|uniref:thiol-disulfide oxidoreductase DCC family protein n=1 Tax=Allomuricauda sp. SCSIO 65647 TaxID=2908843 RepID=UPI001F16C26F|nr:DUF393 domain-containing protein [Muricauda sp. SCSIO 65647]UJH66501.1 DUF393 domain-containing protein [Muricauda sp. SCSIO 65647]
MKKSLIIFDGECNLCNGVVNWLFKVAPNDVFEFVPFQSRKGQSLLLQNGFSTQMLETVILIECDTIFTHSDGFLKIVSKVPKWKLIAAPLGFVPRTVRDTVYKIASKNRVHWFGKSATCSVSL